MNVLVVEDETISREAIAHTLREAGYCVTTACNGREALSLLMEQNHQLVVSDWGMPVMDGIELCYAIRAADLRRYVYFIMVTSHDQPVDALSGFATGVDDYVVKPFNPNELLMRVNVGRRIVQLETNQMTIFTLAKLVETRDPETGAHLERVRSYCRVLAKQLQTSSTLHKLIDDEFVRLIYETSPLHDIGKVAIPDAILLKPGKLTAPEFEVMKTHTSRGAETLDAALQEFPNARFLKMARDIALSHHEKYDGSGYPNGLAGDQIPLCGRIVAVADVYDALTSKRVYKGAMCHSAAREIIVGDRGQHFDPVVVDAFLETEEAILAIYYQYAERTKSATVFPVAPSHYRPIGIASNNSTCPSPVAECATT